MDKIEPEVAADLPRKLDICIVMWRLQMSIQHNGVVMKKIGCMNSKVLMIPLYYFHS